jgi:hypothetical protein
VSFNRSARLRGGDSLRCQGERSSACVRADQRLAASLQAAPSLSGGSSFFALPNKDPAPLTGLRPPCLFSSSGGFRSRRALSRRFARPPATPEKKTLAFVCIISLNFFVLCEIYDKANKNKYKRFIILTSLILLYLFFILSI